MRLIIEQSVDAVINIQVSFDVWHHGWDIKELIKCVNTMPTFLALKSAHIVAKEHLLNLWVLLKDDSLVKVSELIQEGLTISEIFCNILLWFAFV